MLHRSRDELSRRTTTASVSLTRRTSFGSSATTGSFKPKGREFVALCPFHDDHKPSMCVVPAKQMYYCFSCSAGWGRLRLRDGVPQDDVRGRRSRYLAEPASADLSLTPRRAWQGGGRRWRCGGREQRAERVAPRCWKASTTAQGFFRASSQSTRNTGRRRGPCWRKRGGIAVEMVELFQIGAAPRTNGTGLVLTIGAAALRRSRSGRSGCSRPARATAVSTTGSATA